MSGAEANVAGLVWASASARGEATALIEARSGRRATFAELAGLVGRVAGGLRGLGVEAGERVVVMIRPGIGFVATLFGVAALGATPVLFDPGLGLGRMMRCMGEVGAGVLIGERIVQVLASAWGLAFRRRVSMGWWPGAVAWGALGAAGQALGGAVACEAEAAALMAYTSGSTGAPKAVVMPHRALRAQMEALASMASLGPGDVNLAVLPIVALLGPGLGCATVIPALDAARPHRVDAARLHADIARYGVTHSFGSPTIWRRLVEHRAPRGLVGGPTRRVLLGGAPVPHALVEALGRCLTPGAEIQTPYGATEAVPLTTIGAAELLAEGAAEVPGRPVRGALVGRPVGDLEVRIVGIEDGVIGAMGQARVVEGGGVGEVVVRGAVVSPAYQASAAVNALAKIEDEGGAWHRMGDLGVLDAQGRLWLCGRKAERVEVGEGALLLTACVEPMFEAHAEVAQAALVGLGERPRQRAVLVVVPRRPLRWWEGERRRRLEGELLALAAACEATRAIKRVVFQAALPVDVRHRAKILRGELAAALEGASGGSRLPP